MPCTFAGMGEGCKWHKGRLAAKMWMVPRFQLGVTNADPPSPNIDGMEFAPMHDGSTWSLQPRGGGNPGCGMSIAVAMAWAKMAKTVFMDMSTATPMALGLWPWQWPWRKP